MGFWVLKEWVQLGGSFLGLIGFILFAHRWRVIPDFFLELVSLPWDHWSPGFPFCPPSQNGGVSLGLGAVHLFPFFLAFSVGSWFQRFLSWSGL